MRTATRVILAIFYFGAILGVIWSLNEYDYAETQKRVYEPPQTTERALEKLPKKEKSNYTYLGTFTCTAYCPCSVCCGVWGENRPADEYGCPIIYGASGTRLESNKSVAVDTSVIPYGSILLIDGREYVAQDTGGFRGNHLDFYFDTHDQALAFGMRTKEVYIKTTND